MTNEQLVANIQAGIDVAENMLQLWEQNQGMIGKIACKYMGYEDIEDLKQQGYLGLCEAVRGYRQEDGALFATYASFWIRQSIYRYIEECSSVVRIPSGTRGKILQMRRFCAIFEREVGRKPTDREICLHLGCNGERLKQLRKAAIAKDTKSLDAPVQGVDDEEITLGDTVADTSDLEVEVMEKVDRGLIEGIIWPMVDELPGNCAEVVRMRYREGLTLKETGERIGGSIESARRWENNGLRELRKPSRAKRLRPFLEETRETAAYRTGGLGLFNRTWESSTERAAMRGLEDGRQWLPFANHNEVFLCCGMGDYVSTCKIKS